jgi:hypothetical protein
LTDLFAVSLSTLLFFGLGYFFAHQIESSFDRVKNWLTAIVGATLLFWVLYRSYRGRLRSGVPVGPPVLLGDDVPLPPDDLHSLAARAPEPRAPAVTVTESAGAMPGDEGQSGKSAAAPNGEPAATGVPDLATGSQALETPGDEVALGSEKSC